MLEDGERVLNLVGAVLVVGILIALGVVALNFSPPADAKENVPDANWSVERVSDSTVRITHTGGDPVRPDKIRITVDSVKRKASWSDPISSGDSTIVSASRGAMVRVVWNGGRGNREIMDSWRV